MSTQGWMIQAASFSYSGITGPPMNGLRHRSLLDSTDEDREKGESRLELLNRIKSRIKNRRVRPIETVRYGGFIDTISL